VGINLPPAARDPLILPNAATDEVGRPSFALRRTTPRCPRRPSTAPEVINSKIAISQSTVRSPSSKAPSSAINRNLGARRPHHDGAPFAARPHQTRWTAGASASASRSAGAEELLGSAHFSDLLLLLLLPSPSSASALACFSSFHLSTCRSSAERGARGTQRADRPHPIPLAVPVCPAPISPARPWQSTNILKVIPAHVPIALVAREAAVGPLCRLVARIEVLARLFPAAPCQQSWGSETEMNLSHFMNWARASLVHGP
jgi:hypothetical protein